MEMARALSGGAKRATLAGYEGYDSWESVAHQTDLNVTPHVARNASARCNTMAGRTTRHKGDWLSLRRRKPAGEFFRLVNLVPGQKKVELKVREMLVWLLTLAAAEYSLVEMGNLMAASD